MPLIRAALAAGFAWFLTRDVLGHTSGIWGPIGALVIVTTPGRSSRRVIALALGAAIGVAIGDLLISLGGTGPLQVALVAFLAMAAATAMGAESGVVTQAGIASALIATVEPPHGIYSAQAVDRLIDILVGGGVGVAASVLLRTNPLASTKAAGAPLFTGLHGALEQVANALAARDAFQAERALARARTLDGCVRDFQDALEIAQESVRFIPGYRRMRDPLERQIAAGPELELAVRDVRVLARAAVRVIDLEPDPPLELSLAVRELAAAVLAVQSELDGSRRGQRPSAAVIGAAGRATRVLERTSSMPIGAVVAQVRSTAADLLQALGIDHAAALAQVRAAATDRPKPDTGTRGPAEARKPVSARHQKNLLGLAQPQEASIDRAADGAVDSFRAPDKIDALSAAADLELTAGDLDQIERAAR